MCDGDEVEALRDPTPRKDLLTEQETRDESFTLKRLKRVHEVQVGLQRDESGLDHVRVPRMRCETPDDSVTILTSIPFLHFATGGWSGFGRTLTDLSGVGPSDGLVRRERREERVGELGHEHVHVEDGVHLHWRGRVPAPAGAAAAAPRRLVVLVEGHTEDVGMHFAKKRELLLCPLRNNAGQVSGQTRTKCTQLP